MKFLKISERPERWINTSEIVSITALNNTYDNKMLAEILTSDGQRFVTGLLVHEIIKHIKLGKPLYEP